MTFRRHVIVTVVLGVIGAAISGYLTWVHYNMGALVCGVGDCEVVQTSVWATMLGIPIALFGMAMYLADIGLGLARLRLPGLELPLTAAALAISGAGTAYSGWLTWLQIDTIEAFCGWCVTSAGVTALIFINELVNLRRLWTADDEDLELGAEPAPG